MKRLLVYTAFDIRCWWRNGEQLLLMLVLPALAVGFAERISTQLQIPSGVFVDGAVLVSFFATAFTGQSILTAFDRRSNALLVIGAGPLGRRGFIAARVLAVMLTCTLQALILWVIADLAGVGGPDYGLHALIALCAVPAFVAAGLLLAGMLRAEIVLALANLLFVLGGVFGGAFTNAVLSPLGAVRALQIEGASMLPIGVLVVWTVVAGFTAQRTFKWVD